MQTAIIIQSNQKNCMAIFETQQAHNATFFPVKDAFLLEPFIQIPPKHLEKLYQSK